MKALVGKVERSVAVAKVGIDQSNNLYAGSTPFSAYGSDGFEGVQGPVVERGVLAEERSYFTPDVSGGGLAALTTPPSFRRQAASPSHARGLWGK